MSDTKPRQVDIVSKIAVKNIGNPAMVKTMEGDGARHYLGRLAGIATGTKIKTQPNGDTFEGVTGQFMGIPGDEKKPIVRSGVLYLPSGIQEMVIAQIGGDGATVEFVFDIYTIPANNPAGYAYAVSPVRKAQAVDPLDELMAEIEQSIPMPRLDAPAKAAKAAK